MGSIGTALLDAAAESGAKKAAENVINRGLNAMVDFVKKKYKEHQVDVETAFELYLENAYERYNKIRTLATGIDHRSIIGDDSIYVEIGVRYHDREISTSTVEPMLDIGSNILILGTGGAGKSMLMRYLFLNTKTRGDYIPVLLELRRVSELDRQEISILELIYTCMQEFNVQLDKEQFEYSLCSGRYLFLLDGLDEVKESLTRKTAKEIQSFCAKYPNNPCIMTSRPRHDIKPLETFTVLESMTLNKDQAVLLASKIWTEDNKTKAFCKQLDKTLYEQHKDFAENPLLLSMMFLTFMRNNSIPDHLSDFYQKAYEALYSAHDNNDKDYYERDFKCKDLNEGDFKMLLSRFCFQTYFNEIYEFSEIEILYYLCDSIEKLELNGVRAEDYSVDLRNIVCMIIKDGSMYRFSHRSFQTYFAAYYTSHKLKDEEQKKLFTKILSEKPYAKIADYCKLLSQIELERFAVNALEDGLRTIQEEIESNPKPNIYFLKMRYTGINLLMDEAGEKVLLISFFDKYNKKHYNDNIISIFLHILKKDSLINTDYPYSEECILYYINTYFGSKIENKNNRLSVSLTFYEIDRLKDLTNAERNRFYNELISIDSTPEIRDAIREWLHEIDIKRKKLKSKNFIDDL